MRRTVPDDAVLVELDEGDDGAGVPDDGSGDVAHHPRRRRRLWWTGVGVIVVLVAAVVVTNVTEARRAAERRAALADLGWVLPALDGPLHEVWRLEGGWVMGETPDAILVSDPSGDGGLQAIDTDTGRARWSITGTTGYCWTTSATAGLQLSADQLPDPGLIICEGMAQDASTTTGSAVTSYDSATGARLATVRIEGSVMMTSVLGDRYLAGSTLDDGALLITVADLRTGETAWTYRTSPEWAASTLSGGWQITSDDEIVYLDGPEDLALSLSTGEVVTGREPPPQTVTWTMADGSAVVVSVDGSNVSQVRSEVLDADGSVQFAFDGWPMNLYGHFDNQVFLVEEFGDTYPHGSAGTEMVALDPGSGAELWRRADDGSSQPLVALDGVAVLWSPSSATAIDMTSGEVLWLRPVDSLVYFQGPVTDGDAVLLADRVDGELGLTAVDLRTGDDVWRMSAPADLTAVAVTSTGVVLMSTSDGLIAYRP